MRQQLIHFLVIEHKNYLQGDYYHYIAKTQKFDYAKKIKDAFKKIGIDTVIVEETEETRYANID